MNSALNFFRPLQSQRSPLRYPRASAGKRRIPKDSPAKDISPRPHPPSAQGAAHRLLHTKSPHSKTLAKVRSETAFCRSGCAPRRSVLLATF
eukprot:scaffold1651_cov317-Pinguiococcus_pyrenoidosus.AAC.14